MNQTEIDETASLLRDACNDFLSGEFNNERLRRIYEGRHAYERPFWEGLAAQGWLSLRLPEELGGSGLSAEYAALIAHALGGHAVPEPYVACAVLPAALAARFGESESWRPVLEGLENGRYISTLAWQEDAQALSPSVAHTVATRDASGGYQLSGRKYGVVAAGWADALIISAGLDGETALFLIEPTAPGITLTERVGSDGSTVAMAVLESVSVPSTNLLAHGADVAEALAQALDEARLAVAAQLRGVAAAALDLTLDYLRVRKQFGREIGSFQSLQHMAVDVKVQQALAEGACKSAHRLLESEPGSSRARRAVAAAKARASDAALHAGRFGIQAHGAIGFTAEASIGLFMKAALRLAAYLGTGSQLRSAWGELKSAGAQLDPAPAADPDDEAFRLAWRSWIETHYVSPLRSPLAKLTGEGALTWLRAQHRDGWRAPSLPQEAGGMGLSLRRQLIYQEELERYGTARPQDHGVRMVAPILLRYGTPEQKAHYLPRIMSCEDVWCQGYSEPDAGSDLASLRTSARVEGDRLVVNGQKIWTTLAADANMIYMLVRTSTGGKKQEGITFLLVSMDTPGIRVRPIRTLAGEAHFCEVFFDEVEVPMANVVGEIGDGWRVGKALLGFERYSHSSPELVRYGLRVMEHTAQALGVAETAFYQEQWLRLACDAHDAESLYHEICEAAVQSQMADHDASMLKLFNAELVQRTVEFTMELTGQHGGLTGVLSEFGLETDLEWLYMISRPLTVFGGTAQVQRNLLATRFLGLPKS